MEIINKTMHLENTQQLLTSQRTPTNMCLWQEYKTPPMQYFKKSQGNQKSIQRLTNILKEMQRTETQTTNSMGMQSEKPSVWEKNST